jgi:hypothetical protein
MLSVTDIGLAAIANAEQGGFLIDLTDFKVSEYDISGLSKTDTISALGMLGVPVYQAQVTAIEVVDTASVRLTLTVPASLPKAGMWQLREIGVYLASGELFAYGPLVPVYEKTSEYAITIYLLVVANRLGDVINVVVSNNNSLPATPFVRTLAQPQHSYQNAVIVLDENVNDYLDASSASIAVKSGPGGNQWAFVGYNRIYKGSLDSIVDSTTFSLNPDKGGFWLNDNETVICQVVGGVGDGFSRKLTFNKANNTFTTVDKAWQSIASSSTVSIWRSLKNQLPARTADLEDYLVLGVGLNDWTRVEQVINKTKYVAHVASGTFDSLGMFADPAILGATEIDTYVFVEGKCIPFSNYSVAANEVLAPTFAGKAVDVYAFIPTVVAVGGMLAKFESTYPTDGITARYYLPIVPDDTAWVELYIDNMYIPKSDYTMEPTSVLFSSPPTVGTLKIVCFATYEDDVSYTTLKRYFYQATVGQPLAFNVDPSMFDATRTIVYVDGSYYLETDFTIDAGVVTLLKTPLYPNGTSIIDITTFTVVDSSITATVSGTNTGPEWVDPAGRMGTPNKLVPKTMSYTSDGARTVYPVYNVPRKSNIIMLAGGAWQDPRNHIYVAGNKGAAFGTLTILEAIPFGVKIDFICFTDVEDAGRSTLCEVYDFTTTASLTYTIPTVDDENSIFIAIGGAYQHKGSYYVSGNTTLNLQEVVAGQAAEIWYFKTIPHAGWRTEMYVDFNTTGSVNHYPITNKVERKENTLVFLSSVYQLKPTYKVVEADYIQEVQYATPLPIDYYDLHLGSVYFVSGPPLTRLLLREDGSTQYMPRNGPYVDWPNLSYRLRDMLACPITKLLALVTGSMKLDFNNGSQSDQNLANKYGLQPVTKALTMQVLPTAAYAGVGSGATLGAKMTFNVYKYLEVFLKQELGDATFTIHKYEQGKKYFIDNINLGAMTYEALSRASIPMITYDTGIYINYPNALQGTTYSGVPLLTNFFDMIWSRDHVTLPSGFTLGNTSIHTQSVSSVDSDSTQSRTFTHVIVDAFSGSTYTVKWKRPYVVADHNTEYMTLVDAGGAPGYVQYFARLYAQWKYNDADIIKCMVYNKTWQANGGISDIAWPAWLITVRGGAYGNYPSTAAYTANLSFGVVVDSFDASTGDCNLLISITSGTIGYSYFPAEMMIKNIQIPVSYTIYPAISINPDGSINPMISNDDLFKSCCWTDFTASSVLNCGTGVTPNKPTVNTMITGSAQPVITGTYPYRFANSFSVTVEGQTFTKGSSVALSTLNDTWSLDLSLTSVVLSLGFHDVVASADVGEAAPYVDTSVNEISITKVVDNTPPSVPTVTTHTYGNTTPIIIGTYPANDAAGGFSVSINGWSYTLNGTKALDTTNSLNTRNLASAPLTAAGGSWSLDMSKDTANVLTWQTYSVTATVADASGNIAVDLTMNEAILVQPTPTQVAYTTAGTYSLVIPANVTSLTVDGLYGAGAGSGACNNNGDAWVGGGGGSGGKVLGTVLTVTPGETITIIVGKRGFGASYRFNSNYSYNYTDTGAAVGLDTGTAGGATYVMRGSTVLVAATGGTPGSQFGNGIGGSPGGGNGVHPNGAQGYTGPFAGGSNGSGVPPSGHGNSWNGGTGTGYGNGGGESGLGAGCNGQDGAALLSYIIPIL